MRRASGRCAVPDGDDYILNGSKNFITNAMIAKVFIVFCLTDPPAGMRGISAFILERDMPGFAVGREGGEPRHPRVGRLHAPLRQRPHPEGQHARRAEQGIPRRDDHPRRGRIGIAAQAVGIAQAALDASLKYSKERKQFGKPIASFQAISG